MFQGLIAVGLFADVDPLENTTNGQRGVFHGGGWRLLGVQVLAAVTIIGWAALVSFIILFVSIKYNYNKKMKHPGSVCGNLPGYLDVCAFRNLHDLLGGYYHHTLAINEA